MVLLIWSFILLLAIAVIFLIWMQFTDPNKTAHEAKIQPQLVEEKVIHLEENLKKTLEIMQDLAKKMHIQQQILDQTATKLTQVELQNAELISLLAKSTHSSNQSVI